MSEERVQKSGNVKYYVFASIDTHHDTQQAFDQAAAFANSLSPGSLINIAVTFTPNEAGGGNNLYRAIVWYRA